MWRVRSVKRGLAPLIVLCGMLWLADWLILRSRVAHDRGFGEVDVQRRYAVQLKNKRIEQLSQKPEPEECVESIFPHDEESPCWYLKRARTATAWRHPKAENRAMKGGLPVGVAGPEVASRSGSTGRTGSLGGQRKCW
jgi:hypothetical protein